MAYDQDKASPRWQIPLPHEQAFFPVMQLIGSQHDILIASWLDMAKRISGISVLDACVGKVLWETQQMQTPDTVQVLYPIIGGDTIVLLERGQNLGLSSEWDKTLGCLAEQSERQLFIMRQKMNSTLFVAPVPFRTSLSLISRALYTGHKGRRKCQSPRSYLIWMIR